MISHHTNLEEELQSSPEIVSDFKSTYHELAMTTGDILVDHNSTDADNKQDIADWTKYSGRATDDMMYHFHKTDYLALPSNFLPNSTGKYDQKLAIQIGTAIENG